MDGTVEDQLLSGVVDSVTDDAGFILFSIDSELGRTKFSRNSIVVGNVKLMRKASLLDVCNIGTQVIFSIKCSSPCSTALVELEGPVNYAKCSREEIRYVHNKVFSGNIAAVDGSSGIVEFELDNTIKKAVFSKDCVYIGDEKWKDKPITLVCGMPVRLMVLYYLGISGCDFTATVIRIDSDLDLYPPSVVESELLSRHSMFYGTIKSVAEVSGKIAFEKNNVETEALFYRSSVLVNKLKLLKNVPLSSVLQVDTPVSFTVESRSCNVLAKVVEVLQEESVVSPSYTGLLGSITCLTALCGTITFLVNKEERRAQFFRRSVVTVDISKETSLLYVLEVGLFVTMDVLNYEEENSDFIATTVKILNQEVFKVADNSEVVDGVIQKINDDSGLIKFCVNGRDEIALFFRNSVFINKERISQSICLSDVLHISMSVYMRVLQHTYFGLDYLALSVEVGTENASNSVQPNDIKHSGILHSLTESSGIITFCLDSEELKVVMNRNKLFINGKRFPRRASLLELLDVGMPVSFTAVKYVGHATYNYKTRDIEVACLKSSPLVGKHFCGVIVGLNDAGGSISFQLDNENKKAKFSNENVFIIGNTSDSDEVAVSSILKIDMPVSFRMGDVIEPLHYEASAVVVEAMSLANLQQSPDVLCIQQDSFGCQGIIEELTNSSALASFQINGAPEKTLFFKNRVRICDEKVRDCVPISDVLMVGMQVFLMLDKYEQNKNNRFNFKASLVHLESTPKCFLTNASGSSGSQLVHGTVQRLRKTCGIISFNVNENKENAIFFNDHVRMGRKKLDKDASLLNIFNLGMNVSLSVKACTQLKDINFFATAVEVRSSPDISGTIVALEGTSGVVTFWKRYKQQKAVFDKACVFINEKKLKARVSLLAVLRVGMCVLLTVDKFKDHCFNFKATRVHVQGDNKDVYNVTKVSESKHINCGLGIVLEVVSETEARLQFELDGLQNGLFKLSDFFVDGQRCDGSRSLSAYISKGDVYFFDATRKKNEYVITCVWQGKRPGISTFLEPCKDLIKKWKQSPPTVQGTVIAIFSTQAAVVDTDVCGAVLVFVDSLRSRDGTNQLTKAHWIQDYLSVNDKVALELTSVRKCGFPLAKCTWKTESDIGVSRKEKMYPPRDVLSSRGKSLPLRGRWVDGTIESLAFDSGTINFQLDGKVERVSFTCKKVFINGVKLPNALTILDVGMHVSLGVQPVAVGANFKYEAAVVKIDFPEQILTEFGFKTSLSPKQVPMAGQSFAGVICSLKEMSGTISFNVHDRNWKAVFSKGNILLDDLRLPRKITLFKLLKIGTKVILTLGGFQGIYIAKKVKVINVLLNIPEDSYVPNHSVGEGTPSLPSQAEGENTAEFNSLPSQAEGENTTVFNSLPSQAEGENIAEFNSLPSQKKKKIPKSAKTEIRELMGKVTTFLSPTIGLINCCINGVIYEAYFKRDMVFKNKCLKKKLARKVCDGEMVKFNGSLEKHTTDKLKLTIREVWALTESEKSQGNLKASDCNSSGGKEASEIVEPLEFLEMKGHITGYLSSSIGIIGCCIKGEVYEAHFTKDIIISDNQVDDELQKVFPLGETVTFDCELFVDKDKLRLFSVWQDEASQESRRKLWTFADLLCDGLECCGTVIEILKPDMFIVALKNVPILVCKKYFSDPAKFSSRFRSVRLGDSVTVRILRRQSKKEGCDWCASDAWRTKDALDAALVRKWETVDYNGDVVLEGKLETVGKSSGILLDVFDGISFQSADASLFGVSLNDVDLTQVFVPGDVLSYSVCGESQITKVWYGPQEFEDDVDQFRQLVHFCSTRSIDAAILYDLTRRLQCRKLANSSTLGERAQTQDAACERFRSFREQLACFTGPTLTEDVKQILSRFLLSVTDVPSLGVVQRTLDAVESGVKDHLWSVVMRHAEDYGLVSTEGVSETISDGPVL